MIKFAHAFIHPHRDVELVIVAGKHVAKLYIRTKNTLEEIAAFRVPLPKYSRAFAKQLRREVEKTMEAQEVSSVSISVPKELQGKVIDALPYAAQEKLEVSL